jgi:cytoskeleton-associated protein 5
VTNTLVSDSLAVLRFLQAAVPEQWPAMVGILDLLLRWAALRFCDEKLQSVLKVQAFLNTLFSMMHAHGVNASESDANCILPCLCEKVGHKVERVRAGYHDLLTQLRRISDRQRFVLFLMEGMECKNTKSRADCCVHLAALIREDGVGLLTKGTRSTRTATVFKQLATLVGERDPQRNAALGALMAVYEQRGERIWSLLGAALPPVQRDPIVERMKAVDAELHKQGLAAGAVAPSGVPAEEPVELLQKLPAVKVPAVAAPKPTPAIEPFAPPPPLQQQLTLHTSAAQAARLPSVEPTSLAPTLPAPLAGPTMPSAAPAATRTLEAVVPERSDAVLVDAAASVYGDVVAPTPVPGPPPTPTPGVPANGYQASWEEAVQHLRDHPADVAIEQIKTIFYTIAAAVDGTPVDQDAVTTAMRKQMAADIDEVVQMLLSRDLLHYNLATTLKASQSVNPLRGLRYNLNCLLKVVGSKFASLVSVNTLTHVMQSVLTLMCHYRALQDTFRQEGKGILQLLNMVASKAFLGTRVNDYFACLLRCLVDVPAIVQNRGEPQVECYKNLTVKCLTRLTKQYLGPEMNSNLDAEALLRDLHRFFENFSTAEISKLSANNDRSLKMVKTVLHNLCKQRGWPLRDTALAMPEVRHATEQPMFLKHLLVNLRQLQSVGLLPSQENAATTSPSAPVPRSGPEGMEESAAVVLGRLEAEAGSSGPLASPTTEPPPSGSVVQPLKPSNGQSVLDGASMPEPLRKEVMECFQKIGTLATTTEGLERLYDLLSENPHMPIDDLLKRTSEQFQKYINRGIEKVHRRRGKQRRRMRSGLEDFDRQPLPGIPEDAASRGSAGGANEPHDAPAAVLDPYNIQQRLKALEQQHPVAAE